MNEHADALFNRVLAKGDSREADILLQEFVRGYPLERLRLLLRSDNPATARVGVFILSELGSGACPLIDEMLVLLNHTDRDVRYHAFDCVLLCATESNGDLIATAVGLIRDLDGGVRYKALGFLSRINDAQIRAALPFTEALGMNDHLGWLASEHSRVHAEIVTALKDENPMRRRVGVAAAARPGRIDAEALRSATSSGDFDVASFARRRLHVELGTESA